MVSSELDENVQALKNHIQTLLLVKCNFLVSKKKKSYSTAIATSAVHI